MTSTPSASALTAVLRCRGNIWARNPPAKRPAAGRAVAVKRASLRADAGALREEGCGGTDRSAKVSSGPEPAEDARTAARCGPLARQLALQLTSPLSGPDRRARIAVKHAYPAQSCRIALVVGGDPQQPGVIRVSASSCWGEDAGQIPCLVVTGWDALKGSCSSGTELVAQLVLRKLAVLCGSSCGRKGAPRPLRHQDVLNGGLQANGQKLSNNKTGPKVTGDKPD